MSAIYPNNGSPGHRLPALRPGSQDPPPRGEVPVRVPWLATQTKRSRSAARPGRDARTRRGCFRRNGRGVCTPPEQRCNGARSREQLFEDCRTLAGVDRILDRLREPPPRSACRRGRERAVDLSGCHQQAARQPGVRGGEGPGSGGKSWTVERVLQFFPERGVLRAQRDVGARARLLEGAAQAPDARDLRGRWHDGRVASYLIRSLLARAASGTRPSRDHEGIEPKLIEREGRPG